MTDVDAAVDQITVFDGREQGSFARRKVSRTRHVGDQLYNGALEA